MKILTRDDEPGAKINQTNSSKKLFRNDDNPDASAAASSTLVSHHMLSFLIFHETFFAKQKFIQLPFFIIRWSTKSDCVDIRP